MNFPKDEELFRNIPVKGNRSIYKNAADSTDKNATPISAVYNECYRKTADETLAARKGSIKDYGHSYQQTEINKDFHKIESAINSALDKHLNDTDGYIGEFPNSQQYYATVDHSDDYYFDYFGLSIDNEHSMRWSLQNLNRLVYQESFSSRATKSVLSLAAAIACAALMWFCQGWFFTYEGISIIKIAALALIFIGLFMLIWQTSADPDEFALKNFTDDSPVEFIGVGLLAAIVVRIFLSGKTAAIVCCAVAGIFGISFLISMLKASKHLQHIQNRSPVLGKLSLNDREQFERYAQSSYRLMRFRELWYNYENNKDYTHHAMLKSIHQSFMKTVDEYEQWCLEYLRDEEDTGF